MRLAASIILALAVSLACFGQSAATSNEASPSDAVRVIRFFNTLEGWYHYSHGYYAPMNVILESDMFALLNASSLAEERGIGATFFKKLSPAKLEILQGWQFKLNVSSDSQHYTVLIRQKNSGRVFASDEDAVIFAGVLMAKKMPRVSGKAATLLANARLNGVYQQCGANGGAPLSYIAGSLRLVQSGPVPDCTADDGTSFPCQCPNSCQNDPRPPGMCTNCGCASCVWCCRIY